MEYKKIKSIAELKKAATGKNGNYAEFFISIGGIGRSSKSIRYFPKEKTFNINNEIDDSSQDDLTEEELKSQTNICEAIKAGAFYQYLF